MNQDSLKYLLGGGVAAVLIVISVVLFARMSEQPEVVPIRTRDAKTASAGGADASESYERSGRRPTRASSPGQDSIHRRGSDSDGQTAGEENTPEANELTSDEKARGENGQAGAGDFPGMKIGGLSGRNRMAGGGGENGAPGANAGGENTSGNDADGTSQAGLADDPNVDIGQEAEPGQGSALLTGKVAIGETPVPGAVLRLSASTIGYNQQATTGSDGVYRFPNLEVSDYSLSLVEPSSSNSFRTVRIANAGQTYHQDFIIPELPPVEGTVVNDQTGSGVSGARIVVLQGGTHMGSVNSKEGGRFTLFPLSEGIYTLTVEASGYQSGEKNINLKSLDSDSFDVEIRLTPTQNISGVVYLPDGTQAQQGVTSLFGTQSLYNDPYQESGWVGIRSNGSFEFSSLDPSITMPFRVGAFSEGYLPAYSEVFEPGNFPASIEVRLKSGPSLRGVIMGSDGLAVPGADVQVTAGFAETKNLYTRFNRPLPNVTTGDDGVFELKPVEPGPVELTVAAEGYIQGKFDLDVPVSGLDAGELTLDASDEAKPGRIFGVAVDENFTPMINQNIYVRNQSGSGDGFMTTDSQGGFKFDNLSDGEYLVTLSGSTLRGDLWIPLSYDYPFARPGGEKIYLVFDLSHAVELQVVDSNDNPVKDFKVGVRVEDIGSRGAGGKREKITMNYQRNFQSSDGRVTIDSLIAGRADFTISAPNTGTAEVTDVLVPIDGVGDAGQVVIQSGAGLEGYVSKAEGGGALSGVRVQAVAPAGSPPDHPLAKVEFIAFTDATGFFRLTGLPAGNADLLLTAQGRMTHRESNISLEGNRNIDLGEIPMELGAVLSGTITDPSGTPIDGVMVNVAGHTLFADGQGRYRGDFLPSGNYTLTAVDQKNRYSNQKKNVDLVSGQETVLPIRMQ